MKKKIVAMCATVALAAVAIAGGSLAYFTDEDSAKNVMTTGNVAIEQLEQQRAASGGLEPFVQKKALFPMVDNRTAGEGTVVDGYFNAKMANVLDKIVNVENEGSVDAYVRTIIAFETGKVFAPGSSTDYKDAHDEYIGVLGDFDYVKDASSNPVVITVNGVDYVIAVKVYDAALAPGAATDPSLKQVFLAPTAGNEVVSLFGDTYDILALSQGVQTAGFANAATALDTAFGEVNATNCTTWFTAIA